MPIDFAVTARMCGSLFGSRRAVPVLHRHGEPDLPLPRGVLDRRAVTDTVGAGTRLSSFETVFSCPIADVSGRPVQQGDEVTDAAGVRRTVIAAQPDEGGMLSLMLQE